MYIVRRMVGLAWKVTSPVYNVWFDVLFGLEEPFEYTSITCPPSTSQ